MNAILRREPLGTLLEEFFTDPFARGAWALSPRGASAPAVNRARMDIVDRGDRYAVTVDLPGVRKEDIKISVEGSHVSLSAETRTETQGKPGDQVLHSERTLTSYARSFELPAEVTEQGASATFENGVLQLDLPKRAQIASRQIPVN